MGHRHKCNYKKEVKNSATIIVYWHKNFLMCMHIGKRFVLSTIHSLGGCLQLYSVSIPLINATATRPQKQPTLRFHDHSHGSYLYCIGSYT